MKNKTLFVLKKEVLGIVKDRKTLLIMLLTPLLVPFVILLYGWLGETIDNTEKTHTIGINYELSDYEKELLDELNLEPVVYDTLGKLTEGYDNDEYLAYIFKDEKGKYTIYSNEGSTDGMMVSGFAQSYLQSYNQYLGNLKLIGEDLDPEEIYGEIKFEKVELTETSYMDNMMFSMATTYIIMIICITASTVTTDSIAGEKERGTLETLLTFPITKKNIIAGKYLSILGACTINTILSLILMYVGIIINNIVFKTDIHALSFSTIFYTLIICILGAVIISGICLGLASKAKTHKEAQQTLSSISMFTLVPMLLTLTGTKTTIALAVIPIVGNQFVLNDIVYGSLEPINLLAVVISNIVVATIIIRVVAKLYSSEKVLFS